MQGAKSAISKAYYMTMAYRLVHTDETYNKCYVLQMTKTEYIVTTETVPSPLIILMYFTLKY